MRVLIFPLAKTTCKQPLPPVIAGCEMVSAFPKEGSPLFTASYGIYCRVMLELVLVSTGLSTVLMRTVPTEPWSSHNKDVLSVEKLIEGNTTGARKEYGEE